MSRLRLRRRQVWARVPVAAQPWPCEGRQQEALDGRPARRRPVAATGPGSPAPPGRRFAGSSVARGWPALPRTTGRSPPSLPPSDPTSPGRRHPPCRSSAADPRRGCAQQSLGDVGVLPDQVAPPRVVAELPPPELEDADRAPAGIQLASWPQYSNSGSPGRSSSSPRAGSRPSRRDSSTMAWLRAPAMETVSSWR